MSQALVYDASVVLEFSRAWRGHKRSLHSHKLLWKMRKLDAELGDRAQGCAGMVQVRLAFLAGLAVVLALIPVNRWLSKRIEAASAEMMGCKDARIRRTGELLRGIRQIKAAAWEPAFLARVGAGHGHKRKNAQKCGSAIQ